MKPFLTSNGSVDGAIVMAVEIDVIKQAQALIEARDYALAVLATVREPLVVLDANLRIGLANEAYYRALRRRCGKYRRSDVARKRAAKPGPIQSCSEHCIAASASN